MSASVTYQLQVWIAIESTHGRVVLVSDVMTVRLMSVYDAGTRI